DLRIGRLDETERRRARLRVNVQKVRFGIERAAGPVRRERAHQRRERSFELADHGWSKNRTGLVLRDDLQRLGVKLRGEIDQLALEQTLPIVSRRLRGKRLRRRV